MTNQELEKKLLKYFNRYGLHITEVDVFDEDPNDIDTMKDVEMIGTYTFSSNPILNKLSGEKLRRYIERITLRVAFAHCSAELPNNAIEFPLVNCEAQKQIDDRTFEVFISFALETKDMQDQKPAVEDAAKVNVHAIKKQLGNKIHAYPYAENNLWDVDGDYYEIKDAFEIYKAMYNFRPATLEEARAIDNTVTKDDLKNYWFDDFVGHAYYMEEPFGDLEMEECLREGPDNFEEVDLDRSNKWDTDIDPLDKDLYAPLDEDDYPRPPYYYGK